ncbi:TPA: hypothetical protein N0F65_009960 [Lagenidium giganteum]|uniref:Uncharacterized protein n=1 Tax=Lagenidium giganteum TaxID=4803 RepID=A0AAV2YR44_9STRA|nr:TPA: hypothetical protein N0F65_009960 [Lagenidium giganteum]
MVATPTSMITFAAIALSALHGVMATPLDLNPTTDVGDVVELGPKHPAYGSQVPKDSYAFRTTNHDEPSGAAASNSSETTQRKLEATNTDIQRLETHFGAKMERNFGVLSGNEYKSAEFSPVPWPSSYWPIYQDGINYQWKSGEKSPSEKYAEAYGLDVTTFTERISRNNGVLSQSSRRECSSNADCSNLGDGSVCGRRRGESKGYCIPGWFGICHAWAPAAIMEPEPRCAVRKGSVKFEPFDIKALLTQIYDGANVGTVFTGARFNGPDNAPNNKDQYGRFRDAARRDIGAGFFHIAMTNIMGRFKKSFVVDVTAGSEVWNQPVRKYEVLDMYLVDTAQVAREIYKTDRYPFNNAMKQLAYVRTKFSWIVEAGENGPLVSTGAVDQYTKSAEYTYLLELDGKQNIIGGEWLWDSNDEHPDFLWFPTGRPSESTVTNVGLSYKDVRELLDASVRCEDLNGGGGNTPSATPSATPSTTPSATPVPVPGPAPGPGPVPAPGPNSAGEGEYEYIGSHPDRAGYTRWCNQNCPGNCPSNMCRKRSGSSNNNNNSNNNNGGGNHNNGGGNNNNNNNGGNTGGRYRYIGSHPDREGYTRWCNYNCPGNCPTDMCALNQ